MIDFTIIAQYIYKILAVELCMCSFLLFSTGTSAILELKNKKWEKITDFLIKGLYAFVIIILVTLLVYILI